MAYQQRLIDILGGCHMHMHGTRLYKLLPLVAQLRGLISIELADDGLREVSHRPLIASGTFGTRSPVTFP